MSNYVPYNRLKKTAATNSAWKSKTELFLETTVPLTSAELLRLCSFKAYCIDKKSTFTLLYSITNTQFSLNRTSFFSEKKYMKQIRFFICACIMLSAFPAAFAKKALAAEEKDLYEYNNIISSLESVSAPKITERYIIFTHRAGPRHVGIVFDYENFSIIHTFQNHTNRDIDGNVTGSLLFYILERPEKLTTIKYRLIIDGLWTSDPENPEYDYDATTGISLSLVQLGSPLPDITGTEKNGFVKFIYNGAPGSTVRLAGTFTNWDSWIYQLSETKPGFYEIAIPLPEGKYYYNYYIGMKAVVDKTNPNRAYAQDGRAVSVLTVE